MTAPVSSFMGLQVALRGLLAQQRGLDVTSHNIANAGTVGYTRQEAVMTAAHPLTIAAGALADGSGAMLGQGVEVEAYRRMRDDFLDLQYRAQNMALGGHDTAASALGNVEAALNEPGDNGINALLGKFWSAWSDVATYPESTSARQALVTHAETLAGTIRQLDATLASVATDAGAQYATITGPSGPVQTIATELQRLNQAIGQSVSAGRAPNDLLDRRDSLLDELSTYGQVSVTDLGGGEIQVNFGDAPSPLVDGTNPPNWPQLLTSPGGKLGALLDLGPKMAAYRTQLNDFAQKLASSVNTAHGAPAFFTVTAGSEASTITSSISAAAVRTGTGGTSGANDIALAVANLRGGPADQAYVDLIGTIGADSASVQRQLSTSQALVLNADSRRQEVSGVAMDEEVTNMIRFQRGFQASSRVMSTVDEMLDTLINRTGRVGL
jgi:flagellar hook-associated protein 1